MTWASHWQMLGVAFVEQEMGKKFGDAADPMLLSVRSVARASMSGMVATLLHLGLNDKAVEGLARKANNERFACDSYRRFVQMYGESATRKSPRCRRGLHLSQPRMCMPQASRSK